MIRLRHFIVLLAFGCFSVVSLSSTPAFADYSEYKQQQEINQAYELYKGAKEGTRYEYERNERKSATHPNESVQKFVDVVVIGGVGLFALLGFLAGIMHSIEYIKKQAEHSPFYKSIFGVLSLVGAILNFRVF